MVNDERIQVISKGRDRAEIVVVTGPKGKATSETRHLRRKGETWKDSGGREYPLKEMKG